MRSRRLRASPRDPSDGAGRAWIDGDTVVTSGDPNSFPIVFEVGPLGIQTGGTIVFRVSYSWDTPQLSDPTAPGYSTVVASADDIVLNARIGNRRSIVIRNKGRPLRAGERVTITYGAVPPGALRSGKSTGAAASIAERNARFWIEVDGDGDRVRSVLSDSPRLDVLPRPADRLVVTLPATAHPGDRILVRIAGLDPRLNSAPLRGVLSFADVPEWFDLPPSVLVDASGQAHVYAVAQREGVVRFAVTGESGISGKSNPMSVSADRPRILWADIHGHSQLSDGSGTPEDFLRYARDVTGLDVVALTDHDYWGVQPLDQHPQHWRTIQNQTKHFHDPGRFVTLLGFEWTHWIHGHRHVLYFEDEGELFSALDPRYDTPDRLWSALEGKPALTFAHHSAGRPIPTNWAFAPDPVLEPLTEIASAGGSSEARDSPWLVEPVDGAEFVRDQLDRGYRLGFVGSSDDHAGHPGSPRAGVPPGGLAGILSEELTRSSVLDAMRKRRTYATNGPRIVMHAALDSHVMGATITVPAAGWTAILTVRVSAPRSLERIDIVRSGRVSTIQLKDAPLDATIRHELDRLRSGEYVYVRVVQQNGGTAWSSPFFMASE